MFEFDREIDVVINIEVFEEELMNCFIGCCICEKCGIIYYFVFNFLKVDGICDIDGGKLY